MPKLRNPRWEELAKLTAMGHKRADAYLGAGFEARKHGKPDRRSAANRCSRLIMSHPEIQARITELETELRENALKQAEVDRDFVLRGLKDNIEKASQAKALRDREGNETGEYSYQGSVVNRGLELMGKELGMFAERFLVGDLDSELAGMDPQQLRQFIRGAATEVGLRMVDMNDDDTRAFIQANCERVGLRVIETGGEDSGSGEAAEDRGLPAVPEAEGVSRARTH